MSDHPALDFQNLSEDQVIYILEHHHFKKLTPIEIWTILTSVDCFEKHSVKPCIGLSKQYLYKLLQPDGRLGKKSTRLAKYRVERNLAIGDLWLASKRARIEELTTLYTQTKDIDMKRKLLNDIKNEIGEEQWQAAIAKSGKTTVNVNVQDEIIKRLFEPNTPTD